MRVLLGLILFNLYCRVQLYIVRENVVFKKIGMINASQAKWKIHLVIDYDQLSNYLNTINHEVEQGIDFITRMKEHYSQLRTTAKYDLENLFLQHLSDMHNIMKMKNEVEHTYLGIMNMNTNKQIRNEGGSAKGLFNFVGDIMHTLFGVSTDENLDGLRNNIRTLTENDKKIVHIVKQSLTLINTTREQVIENRKTINELVNNVYNITVAMRNMMGSINVTLVRIRHFNIFQSHLSLLSDHLGNAISYCRSYVNRLEIELSALSHQKLPVGYFEPRSFKKYLKQLQDLLPRFLTLPEKPENVWYYYSNTQATTLFDNKHIIVTLHIPLIDIRHNYQVYRAYNLPLSVFYNNSVPTDLSRTTTNYELESHYLAINEQRSSYLIMDNTFDTTCITRDQEVCHIDSAVYQTNLSKLCIIAIFMDDFKRITQNCKRYVNTGFKLPQAIHIHDTLFIVATNTKLDFSVVCNYGDKIEYTFSVQPPLEPVVLNNTCSAHNKYLTLIPYFVKEDSLNMKPEVLKGLISFNPVNLKLLENFHRELPDLGKITIPNKLKNIEHVPITDMIDELNSIREVYPTFYDLPTYQKVLIGVLTIFCILLAIAIYKKRKRILSKIQKAFYRYRERIETNQPTELEDLRPTAPPDTQGSDCHAREEVILPVRTKVSEFATTMYPHLT